MAGRRGSALSFNGTSDYVQLANAIAGSSTFSIAVLMNRTKLSATGGDNNFLTGHGTPDLSYYLRFGTNDRLAVFYYGSDVDIGSAISRNVWHMLCVVIDGASGVSNNLKLYVDGISFGQTTISYTLSTTTSKPWIGGRSDASLYYGGLISKVLFYSRALNAAENKRLAESELMLVRH